MSLDSARLRTLDAIIEPMMTAARIPGAAVAIVSGGRTVFAQGYGYRDVAAKERMTADTCYPIASMTKSLNATLIGMLIDEGRLAWDEPVQTYLPSFRLSDPWVSAQVTLRDLLTLRTGLPRHDWLWLEHPVAREELVARLQYLECSAPFRARYQYNNLTATAAGHIAEVVMGERWETLVHDRILQPLGMRATSAEETRRGPSTGSYLENQHRDLIPPIRLMTEVAAPSGGALYSTVEDMALWIAFNLANGLIEGRRLIQPQTLHEIHSPQIPARTDPSCPSPQASYAIGWFVDTYNGHARVSHGGYLHAVASDVSFFPDDDIGIACFTNFGPPPVPRLLNQCLFDALLGLTPEETIEQKLAEYEKRVVETRERTATLRRVANTQPSHLLQAYAGRYLHPAYGPFTVHADQSGLRLKRHSLTLPLEHWHYDSWLAREFEGFEIHRPHPFDRGSLIVFEVFADGTIGAVTLQLESAVAPMRFVKEPGT